MDIWIYMDPIGLKSEYFPQQACGARPLCKFPKYRSSKKKSEKQIFTPRVKIVLSNANNFEPILNQKEVEKPHYLAFLRR